MLKKVPETNTAGFTKAGGIKFKLNRLSTTFIPEEIRINGKLTGRGRKCWRRVKVKVYFRAGIRPWVDAAAGQPPGRRRCGWQQR